jgi:signal transduction histidine kinase
VKPLASIASNRLETWIRRISSAALFISGIEVVANAVGQSGFTNPRSDLVLAIVILSAAAFIVSAVLFDRSRPWGLVHGLAVLVAIWLVPLTHDADFHESGFERPWVWWSVGMAMILVATSQSRRVWLWYLPLASGSWVWVSLQRPVLAGELEALLDGSYLLVFTLAIVGLVALVREGFAAVDKANSEAIKSALAQAKTDAVERERQRLDALVHDQVLHTLILAARADSRAAQEDAAKSATNAITALLEAQEPHTPRTEVTSLGLFKALESAASKLDARVKTQSSGASAAKVNPEAAQALTEASLQALDNAIQHSKAKEIRLTLEALQNGGLRFTVSDDGAGFRTDRVSKNRIGISTSIKARVDSVGGRAEINSGPGNGTQVVLRWPGD